MFKSLSRYEWHDKALGTSGGFVVRPSIGQAPIIAAMQKLQQSGRIRTDDQGIHVARLEAEADGMDIVPCRTMDRSGDAVAVEWHFVAVAIREGLHRSAHQDGPVLA